MDILNTKSKFLGGSLVSASHLGKLFPGRMVSLNSSDFLDDNGVDYAVTPDIDCYAGWVGYTPVKGSAIWCNDTCTDVGCEIEESNQKLVDFLNNFDILLLHNHQPYGKNFEYMDWFFKQLSKKHHSLIIVYNYRSWWNKEFEFYFSQYHNIKVRTSPYHYYLGYVPGRLNWKCVDKLTCIGRTSQSKISSKLVNCTEYHQFIPDTGVSNYDFLNKLCGSGMVMTGYYTHSSPYEIDSDFNKLEWSAMDAILTGNRLLTSSLFNKEIHRLGIRCMTLDDRCKELNDDDLTKMLQDASYLKNHYEHNYLNLTAEINKGNSIIANILNLY